MVKGQCNCGTVAFEVNAQITDIYQCHCSICRKFTGGNGIPVVVVNNDVFRWTSGEDNIATWKKSDCDWQGWFCSTCGSPLPGSNSETNMYIPAGLISESSEQLSVAHHIWVDSKAQWDVIGDDGKQHPEAFQG